MGHPHNTIDETFARLRAEQRMALTLFLTVGYPLGADTADLAAHLFASGADILELGMPFSDPFGDGPTIQRASQGALDAGMTTAACLAAAARLHARPDCSGKPILLMGYINPLIKFGYDRFCAAAASAGVSGLIIPDVPVEESDDLRAACLEHNLHLIYLLAPTSTPERVRAVAERASGFIYCMGVTGVTGARQTLSDALVPFLTRVRAETALPLVVGFGISRPQHVQALHGHADGVVVASALIDLMDSTAPTSVGNAVADYVKGMQSVCSVS